MTKHITKHQHYDPRFYLHDGFSENNLLGVFDFKKNKPYATSAEHIATKPHFYTISDRSNPLFYEDRFAILEGEAKATFSVIYSRIAAFSANNKKEFKKITLSHHDMCVWLTYLAVQYLRTPARRAQMTDVYRGTAHLITKIKRDLGVSFQESWERDLPRYLGMQDISTDEFCDNIKHTTADLANSFLLRRWYLFTFPADEKLITSDNPVTIFNRSSLKMTYATDPESILVFPLNNHMLVWAPLEIPHYPRPDFIISVTDIGDFTAEKSNLLTTQYCYNYLFGNEAAIRSCVKRVEEDRSAIGDAIIQDILNHI